MGGINDLNIELEYNKVKLEIINSIARILINNPPVNTRV